MAKSVLELAVGTGQWNAGLKKAKSALDNFTQSQGGLQEALGKDSASMQKFVQMMGQIDSQAKTAKGQMNDYKSTIEQLTMQYNRMTEAQKQTIGQDYLHSIDQLRQKYQSVNDELQEMNRSLNQVKETGSSGGGGLFGEGGLTGMLQVAGGNLLAQGVTAFASEMKDTIQQSIELAKAGEGVRLAFERLNRPGLLDNLKEATHGTVSELELMKAAVKFDDFKLPVEELGTLLAFAQKKAKDTGQSVDYMVDSIVTGLGRKSLMILDNLGLSAAQIKERMEEGGDMTKAVAEIIKEQMTEAGEYIETAADRAARAAAEATDKMMELGDKAVPVAEAWTQTWNVIKTEGMDFLTTVLNPIAESIKYINELLAGTPEDVFTKKWEAAGGLAGPNVGDDGKYIKRPADGNWAGFDADKGTWKEGVTPRAIYNSATGQTELPEIVATGTRRPKKTKTTTPRRTTTPKVAKTEYIPEEGTPDFVMAMQRDLQSKLGKEKDSGIRQGLLMDIEALKEEYQQMTTLPKIGDELSDDFTEALSPLQQLNAELKELREQLEMSPDTAEYQNRLQAIADKEQEIKKFKGETDSSNEAKSTAKAWQTAAGAVQSVGSALQSLEDPSAKIVGIIGQAVANIALGFAQATAKDTKLGVWGWIASVAGGLATMVSTISAIHSATGYAEGGIVKGTTYSGDQIPAMLNAGEVVLNHSQVNNLANDLQYTGVRNLQLSAVLSAEQIRLVLNNNGRRTGRGEYVTTNFRQ